MASLPLPSTDGRKTSGAQSLDSPLGVIFDIPPHLVKPPCGLGLGLRELRRSFHLGPSKEIKLDLRLGSRGAGGESNARQIGVKDQEVAGGLGQGASTPRAGQITNFV